MLYRYVQVKRKNQTTKMNSAEFKKLITNHFSPKIRKMGWKGSGFNFRKIEENHIVKIFGIQGSWMGGSVCCETAIHFDFIPDLAGKSSSKISYASCIIRERLSPKGEGDFHWQFRNKEEENIKSIIQIWEAFKTHGQTFYKDFDNFPKPFDQIEVNDLSNRNYKLLNKYHIYNHINFAWILKEINQFIGNSKKAKEFSEFGIQETIDHAESMADNNRGRIDTEYIEINRKRFEIK